MASVLEEESTQI